MTTQQAHELGRTARINETAKAPAQDVTFNAAMAEALNGLTGSPRTRKFTELAGAWNKGYMAAHLDVTRNVMADIKAGVL